MHAAIILSYDSCTMGCSGMHLRVHRRLFGSRLHEQPASCVAISLALPCIVDQIKPLVTYPACPCALQTSAEQLHCSVDEIIWSEEQDWSQPRKQNVESEGSLLAGGWGSKRTLLFSGIRCARTAFSC